MGKKQNPRKTQSPLSSRSTPIHTKCISLQRKCGHTSLHSQNCSTSVGNPLIQDYMSKIAISLRLKLIKEIKLTFRFHSESFTAAGWSSWPKAGGKGKSGYTGQSLSLQQLRDRHRIETQELQILRWWVWMKSKLVHLSANRLC